MPWAWALPGHFTPDGHGAGETSCSSLLGRDWEEEYTSRGPAQGNLSACVLRPEAAGRE